MEYHDPHYRPNRTAAQYEAEKKRDEAFSRRNAVFVAKFLADWGGSKIKDNPAEAIRQLRIEARRIRLAFPSNTAGKGLSGQAGGQPDTRSAKGKLVSKKRSGKLEKYKGKPPEFAWRDQERKVKAPQAAPISTSSRKALGVIAAASEPHRREFPKARLEADTSVRYLAFSLEELLDEYSTVQSKIDRWCAEYDVSDVKRKQVLGTQLRVQYLKRRDLIALINFVLCE